MLNKPMTALSALATLFCAAWPAQAVSCQLKALFSASSDFVAVPYTFGSRLDYRPVLVDREIPCPFAGEPPPIGRETASDGNGIE